MKQEIYKVHICPSTGSKIFTSWESKIKENFGPLSGYSVDLEQSSINDILLSILKFKRGEMTSYQNYFNIRGIYKEHIKSLQDNLEEEDNTLKQELQVLESDSPSSKVVDILLKYGILSGIDLFIPYEKNYKQYADIMGDNTYIGSNPQSLYNKYYEGLIVDYNYAPENVVPFAYSDIKLAVQVLIYSKAKEKIYDVTNFLSNVSTNVVKESGGNFELKMHLISSDDLESNSHFQDNNISSPEGCTKSLMLQSIFRENDLVFIRFEKLKAEKDIVGKKIKGKYWDMVGLIDSTNIFSDYNSVDISITGRDLVKLLIEDNNIFIPYLFSGNPEAIFGGQNNLKIFKRLFATGEYNVEFIKSFKSIENSIGFILSQLTNIEILEQSGVDFLKKEYNNDLSKQFIYTQAGKEEKQLAINGIWGLINYLVDEKISHYRLADASLKSPDGSTIQQILKICQAPFVEALFDTFVDKYTIIARRPPFAIEDIQKEKFIVVGKDKSISDSLSFDREVYTIYQLNPQGGCFADNTNIPLSYLPLIVLDEYTKMWGNKMYSQTYNYINIDAYTKIEGENKKSIKETFIEDLIWLIKSTMYLPFSRRGTITIKGDRRIKVGQWIYYAKTNEIFYVDGVNHTAQIQGGQVDRYTILNVSRGLVKDYIKPVGSVKVQVGNSKVIYYNNISYDLLVDNELLTNGLKELCLKQNTDFYQKAKQNKEGDSVTISTSSSLVNKEVFDFFIKGYQFKKSQKELMIMYAKPSAVNLDDIK